MDVTSRFRVKIRRRRERIKERRGGTHGDYRRSIGYAAVKVKLQRAGWEVGGKRRNGHNAGLKVDNDTYGAGNAITLYAIGVSPGRGGGKAVARRRGGSRFTHTKSRHVCRHGE